MRNNSNHLNNKDNSKKTGKLTSGDFLSKIAKDNISLRDLVPTNPILEFAKQQNALREKINPISTALKEISTVNTLSEFAKQQNSWREKLNPLFSFQDTIRELSTYPLREASNNSTLSIILGGSTITTLVKLSSEASKFNPTSSALELIRSNQTLFDKQISIFEKLREQFHEGNKFWEQINSVKDYSTVKSLSTFEILSANTLSQIIGKYPDEDVLTNAEEELDKMGSLIEENEELKLEIEKLLKKIPSPSKNKNFKKQLSELEDPIKQFSLYIHLKLFKNNENWSLKRTYYFIYFMNYIFFTVIFSKLLENSFFDNTPQSQSITNNNISHTDNRKTINIYGFDSTSVWGMSIKDSKVYLRKSAKTNCIGIVQQNTTVRVLHKKGEWLFIESAMTKFGKKTKMEVEFVSRGWIKQEFVSFEQE